MIQNFFFRSAVKEAALWNLQNKVMSKDSKEDKPFILYDNGNKIKVVFK